MFLAASRRRDAGYAILLAHYLVVFRREIKEISRERTQTTQKGAPVFLKAIAIISDALQALTSESHPPPADEKD